MSLAQNFLPEFDHEIATTRKLLAAIPEDRAAWKPHPKSLSLGDLALHIANLVHWVPLTLETSEFDAVTPGSEKAPGRRFESTNALLASFEKNAATARAAIASASDETMKGAWSLKAAGKVKFSMPRTACLRSFILNHLIHHRGQLTVYLRLCEVPLPSVYGPTADAAW